jgi:hypothetical protein
VAFEPAERSGEDNLVVGFLAAATRAYSYSWWTIDPVNIVGIEEYDFFIEADFCIC